MPADKKDKALVDETFFNLVGPARDLDRSASFSEVSTNLENLHYDFSLIKNNKSEERWIELFCQDHLEVHIEPMFDENNAELNLTQWYEHTGAARQYYLDFREGVTGSYFYQAKFSLILNEWDPVREEELGLEPTEDPGIVEFGSIECTAYNFQEFIESAIFKLSTKFDIGIYPKRKPLKRKVA
jgi:hypothetical protein